MLRDLQTSAAGRSLIQRVREGSPVRLPATAEAFEWARLAELPLVEITRDADLSVFTAMQCVARRRSIDELRDARSLLDALKSLAIERAPLVFVVEEGVTGVVDPFFPRIETALDARFARSVAAPFAPLLDVSQADAEWLDRAEGSAEHILLGSTAIAHGAAPAEVPWPSRTKLLALLEEQLDQEARALLRRLRAFGRSVERSWVLGLLSDSERRAFDRLAARRLLFVHAERAFLLSGGPSADREAESQRWIDQLRSSAGETSTVSPWTFLELHRLLASSDRSEDRLEAARWARFGASVLLARAATLSRSGSFAEACDIFRAVNALADDGAALDPQSHAYAVHYEHFNGYLAERLSARQLVAGYRKSVSLWPKNSLFWQHLIVASGGLARRGDFVQQRSTPPAFEALCAAHADARRATDDNDETRRHIDEGVVRELLKLGGAAVIAAVPIASRDEQSPSQWLWLRQCLRERVESCWLWAAPEQRVASPQSFVAMTELEHGQYTVRIEALSVIGSGATLDHAWSVAIDGALRRLEELLIGDASARDRCPPLDERWMRGGGAFSQWVAALSAVRDRNEPALRRLRRVARLGASLPARPRIEIDGDLQIELTWTRPAEHDGQLIVTWRGETPASYRWSVRGRLRRLPTFGGVMDEMLGAAELDKQLAAPTEVPDELWAAVAREAYSGAAIYAAQKAGAVTDMTGYAVGEAVAGATSYFVDPTPELRWSHPCLYVLPRSSGDLVKLEAFWPPEDIDLWQPLEPRTRE